MKVSLFITCLSDVMYPRVGEAMVRMLARCGVQLDFPEVQTCCGQPAFNSGYWDEARASAKTLLEAFEDSDFVISPIRLLHGDDPPLLSEVVCRRSEDAG